MQVTILTTRLQTLHLGLQPRLQTLHLGLQTLHTGYKPDYKPYWFQTHLGYKLYTLYKPYTSGYKPYNPDYKLYISGYNPYIQVTNVTTQVTNLTCT